MYVWNPEDYSKASSAQQRMAMELLAGAELHGDERVLDIGCGDGKITAYIAGLVPRGSVLGIDQSEEMILYAQQTYPPEDYLNLAFDVGDASHLAFEEEFDVIVSNSALHWVLDQGPVLAGIMRALKPGGHIYLQMGGRGNVTHTWEVLRVLMAQERWARYFNDFSFPYGFYGPEEYGEWLVQAGLVPRRVELVVRDMALEGREGLAAWIRTTWLPFTQRIPEELRDGFVDELTDEYVKIYPPDSEGLVHIDMIRLMVEADKPA